MKNKSFEIKEGNDAKDMQYMTWKMFIVWGHFVNFAETKKLPVVITNIIHKFAVSKSNTHPEGRAIDASTRGWTDQDIEDCERYMYEKAGKYGAVSFSTGKPRVLYYHDAGLGSHFHLQVSR